MSKVLLNTYLNELKNLIKSFDLEKILILKKKIMLTKKKKAKYLFLEMEEVFLQPIILQ